MMLDQFFIAVMGNKVIRRIIFSQVKIIHNKLAERTKCYTWMEVMSSPMLLALFGQHEFLKESLSTIEAKYNNNGLISLLVINNGAPFVPNLNQVMRGAVIGGHLQIIEWAHQRYFANHHLGGMFYKLADEAVVHDHVDIVRFFGQHWQLMAFYQFPCEVNKISSEAMLHTLIEEVFQLTLPYQGVDHIPEHMTLLLNMDNVNCEGLLLSLCYWCSHNLDMIKYLHANSLPLGIHLIDDMARHGSLEGVKFILKNQTASYITTETMNSAAAGGHLDVVRYLHETRTEGCTTQAIDSAASGGHLHVVQYLHETRTEGFTHEAMELAGLGGHTPVLEYLNNA
ncbi:hypothetical protein SAMD00019534_036150, partial [Acytostelium subglobosum LB1]|uniref:hypothetical protein n=1 Tax=Acytostelium subglobosum LB1 TaxID=1410327 RepID=UPI00064517D8